MRKTTMSSVPSSQLIRRVTLLLGIPTLIGGVGYLLYSGLDRASRRVSSSEAAFDPRQMASDIDRVEIETTGSVQITSRFDSMLGSDDGPFRIRTRVVRGTTQPTVRNEVVDRVLYLKGDCPPLSSVCAVHFRIEGLPANVEVVVDSGGSDIQIIGPRQSVVEADSGGGDVFVVGSVPEVEVRSDGGDVEVAEVGKSLRIDSNGGSIAAVELHAPDVNLESNGGNVRAGFMSDVGRLRVNSNGGGVKVEVPRNDVNYRVRAVANGGSRLVEIRTDPAATREIEVDSNGGDILMEYNSL
jgi:hypothetical protein